MSDFYDNFNAALPDMEAAFGESWTLGSSTFPAISIDKLGVGSKVMKGGQFIDANTTIFVRLDVFNGSGVKKGSIVNVRGTDLAVLEIDSDGDDSRTLVCGPASLDLWGIKAQDVPAR